MIARGELVEARLRPTVCEAVENAAASLDMTGVRALRVLLHAGFSAYWPLVKATPAKQLRAYEEAVQRLRAHWDGDADTAPDAPGAALFQDTDAEVGVFLELCARLAGAQWLEPVDAIAAYVVSVLQGAVLRWLADRDDETILVVLDDVVSSLATRAADA
ncbi:TetR family transcriptional regulator [Nocardia cyriacigeorgica]|uniref:TetR family transcriptional regulator n=1 Tax=Nocardia cyriacigeorgica TaxID=135487 RepID=UPI0024564A1A|nr:TetR family transcriptional regulator [Nocardia cyriacigeorgica]